MLLEADCVSFDQFYTALSSFVTPVGLHSVLFGPISEYGVLYRRWSETLQLQQWDMRLRHLSLLIFSKLQSRDLNAFNQAAALATAQPDAPVQVFRQCSVFWKLPEMLWGYRLRTYFSTL